jgi:DNA helicase INO80
MAVFEGSATRGKDEYYRQNEGKAWKEVQAQEVKEEKERKKDMQRKRRREKALQQESEKRAEAVERLKNADDGEERARAEREVAKHEKKMRHTASLLSGVDVSKELRDVTPQGPNLEGGVMGSFQAGDEGKSKSKTGGARMSTRPRKSKEQKQAEKDAAAAAQAAIERGEDLPTITPKKAERLEKLGGTKSKDGRKSGKDGKKGKKKEVEEDLGSDEELDEPSPPSAPRKEPFTSKIYNQVYESIWKEISKKDIGKVYRIKNESTNTKASNLRKTAQLAGKEARRFQLRTNKNTKEVQARAKRSMREMTTFWRRNERDERDQRKMAERQELENAKRQEAEREAARQRRKLNFLISQTELYSHFIGKKVKTQELERSTDDITATDGNVLPPVERDDMPEEPSKIGSKVTNFEDLDFDNEDESALREAAMANAQNAIQEAKNRAQEFDQERADEMSDGEMNFQNPTSLQTMDVSQPKMLSCTLKEYQLKGLNWLCNLYEQGINGILADEMGLGKTVQSISVMAYLAEVHNIWGPFLVVAPASTLHNWQQEIAKFVPEFKVLPYWGAARDRKVLRKFWDRKHLTYRKDAAFHILITSYQIVVQDTSYFQRMTWQYMILDEAQAIKSSSSSRWKSLLQFHCRNRLLLTGTPIQNNMQELWALLHFIMPTLFDSHDEFSEWFSKDIESHAQSNTKLNEDQLKRLHMILKPFMLRRVKKHVQKELGDKIEMDLFCDLTYRQRAYYTSLRNKISLMDLIEKAQLGDDQDAATLMNLVMQFRKVCNHPDLFERAETSAPFSFSYWAETASFSREGNFVEVAYSSRNCIEYTVPRLVYRDSGRLNVPGPKNQNAGWRNKALNHMMNIYNPDYIAQSVRENGAFSWLRFADVSAGEVYDISRKDVFQRAVDLKKNGRQLGRFRVMYDGEHGNNFSPIQALFNIADQNDCRPLADITTHENGRLANLLNIQEAVYKRTGIGSIETGARPGATAPPITLECSSQSANIETERNLFNIPMRTALYKLSRPTEDAIIQQKLSNELIPRAHDMLPEADQHKARYTHITVPSMRRFVSDCGKLARLDLLLKELKAGGHRVLLYFQMTRMIDMMEEYLTYRNYKYCRLDGSTKLEDRRDTVADFQTREDIFIFLLSTRAGGLGINLTAADTVIFYDSDWNPTIDSQAMDRAHRLGQLRQVTVYRLITRGTIEERIRKRALQKEEVQRVVISGQSNAGSGIDFNTRSRENRTKDIALWLADDEQAEEIEKREAEALARGETGDTKKASAKKRKRAMAADLEDMYHEGEFLLDLTTRECKLTREFTGEGRFEDSAKPSGAATPIETPGPPAKRKRGTGGKKAKTMKQRLAIADGEVNV